MINQSSFRGFISPQKTSALFFSLIPQFFRMEAFEDNLLPFEGSKLNYILNKMDHNPLRSQADG